MDRTDTLGATIDAANVEALTVPKTVALAQAYGIGGYELKLAETPAASRGDLFIRLLDQQGIPLSDRIYFDTEADCARNLVIVQFQQVR